jgi:hypothetical protein
MVEMGAREELSGLKERVKEYMDNPRGKKVLPPHSDKASIQSLSVAAPSRGTVKTIRRPAIATAIIKSAA